MAPVAAVWYYVAERIDVKGAQLALRVLELDRVHHVMHSTRGENPLHHEAWQVLVENGKLVGIITTSDILHACLDVIGASEEGTFRIDLLLEASSKVVLGSTVTSFSVMAAFTLVCFK